MSLTETIEIIDHKIHLDMTLPASFNTKRVTVTISPEIDHKNEIIDPDRIKKLRGKLNLTDEQYQKIQEFLNEDR
jgi:DNA-binding transcriptional regulator YiaG